MAQYRQGQLAEQNADAKLAQTESELLLKVAQTYFKILTNRDKLTAIRKEKAAYRQQLYQARITFEKGAATVIDIHEAQAGYDAALAKEIAVQADLITADNAITDLTGLNAEDIAPIGKKDLGVLLGKTTKQQWQQIAEQNNPKWLQQQLALAHACEALKAARGVQWPKLNLSAGYQTQHNTQKYHGDNIRYRSKGGTLTIQLSMPLYSGGQDSSHILEAAAHELQQQELLIAVKRKIGLAVKQAYYGTRSNHYRVLAQQRLLDSTQSKLNATNQLGKKAGIRSNLEAIQAQHAKSEAEQKLSEARYAYFTSYLLLLQNAGVINQTDHQEKINRLLFSNIIQNTGNDAADK
mgnify:CR=1 FL=1